MDAGREDKINDVRLKQDKLVLTGNRIWVAFANGLQKPPTLYKGPDVTVEIERAATDVDGKDLSKALNLIFLGKQERLSDYVPAVWQHAVDGMSSGVAEEQTGAKLYPTAQRVGKGVSAPSIKKQVDPSFSPEAKGALYEGVCILSAVINENGEATNIKILRALGMGLDERAVEALQKWRFNPAMKDGHPVAVLSNFEINFRLY